MNSIKFFSKSGVVLSISKADGSNAEYVTKVAILDDGVIADVYHSTGNPFLQPDFRVGDVVAVSFSYAQPVYARPGVEYDDTKPTLDVHQHLTLVKAMRELQLQVQKDEYGNEYHTYPNY